MANTSKRARFYTGPESSVSLSPPRRYGVKGKSSGPQPGSGKKKSLSKSEHPDTVAAKKKVAALRKKKADRGRKRLRKKIDEVNEKYSRGEYTEKQRDMRIKQLMSEYAKAKREAEAKSSGETQE